MSEPTASTQAPPAEGEKGPSKRALEKEAKKAAAKAKKAAYALRPKEQAKPALKTEPTSIFSEGWLKRIYEEKPVKEVRTRFPPEPNGFLHIGHAKAIAVDFGFAKHHNGVCYLRYDDTNPEKEEEKYFTAILDIVKWLGFEPWKITYSSDNFDKLYELAEQLITKDGAYVCHCSREEINMQRGGPDNRGKRYGCDHRTRPIEESITEFRAMRDGKYQAGEAFLRMKQKLTDPNEGNPQMWDLPAYRVVKENHHHRTGDKWRIYPTYDFTHCICDALEGITHSLCTVEFRQSRISYDWLLEQLDMKVPKSEEKGPMQREFGRLSVGGTILSKRRILQLVEGTTVEQKNEDGTVKTKKIAPAVRGWDDPRLYTMVALRRRGIPAKAMLNFVDELGVTDSLTEIEPPRFESSIRKHLERTVPRQMLVLDPIKVIIEDFTAEDEQEMTVPYDPKGTIPGERKVKVGKEVYIDRTDFREEDSEDYFRLAPNKAVGLYNVPFSIRATSFTKDTNGNVSEIKAVKVPASERPKAYVQWVDAATAVPVAARLYNSLFKTESPNTLDWKTGGWADDLHTCPIPHPPFPIPHPRLSSCSFTCCPATALKTRDSTFSMAMHLASMMHGSVRDREAFQHPQQAAHYFQHSQPQSQSHSQSQSQSQSQPHQHFQPPPQRHLHQQQQQPAYQVHQHRPQSPPSPPAEEQKPSLPSISSLLEFAGGDKAASEPASQSPQSQHRQSSTSPQPRQAPHRQPGAMQQPPHPQMSRSEQQPSHVSVNPRMTLPPTPPMHADVAHDGNTSPSAASTHSAASAAYFGASLNNMEPHRQRQSASSMPSMKRDPLPSHAMSPFSASSYGQPPYTSSPGGVSSSSFYSPEQHSYNRVGMYGQQPLPSNFQPQNMPLPVPVPNSAANSSNPWQHHHYISTSSQSQFPQSQDRYICSTCNKAFSRPSSLRIHSHSHTGEKPYKCPQPNCGKAFSVRSNMKRHERGCHAATSTTLTT